MRSCARRTSAAVRCDSIVARTRSWYGSIRSAARVPVVRTRLAARSVAACWPKVGKSRSAARAAACCTIGPPATAIELEHALRVGVEAAHAIPERVLEVQRRAAIGPRRPRVAHQLVDEQRVPARLLGDGRGRQLRRRRRARARRRQELGGESARVVGRQARQVHLARLGRQQRRARRRRLLARPRRGQEQHRRRVRRPRDRLEERQRVEIGPLQIVDDHDEHALGRHAREQLAQRREELPAQLLRIAVGGRPRRRRHRLDAPEHREDLGEQARARRQHHRRLHLGQPRQPARQRVDDAVERLVGHALALVAAPLQHHDVGRRRPHLVDEVAHQRALAHARLAAHVHGHAGAGARALPRRLERGELGAPPDEARLAMGRRRQLRRRVGAQEPLVELLGAEALARVPAQQADAERVEIGRHVGRQRARRHRLAPLLLQEHLERRADEGHAAGERLVEHDADGVPVGLGPDLAPRRLLGRHVVGGADDADVALARAIGRRLRQAEVEQHHAPGLGLDEDVRRLDVAMHDAGGVQRAHAARQLDERRAQPRRRRRAGAPPARASAPPSRAGAGCRRSATDR